MRTANLRFAIAQAEGARPSFDRGVIGQRQFCIRVLQIGKHRGVVDGDGSLAGHRLKDPKPFGGRRQQRAVIDLQHAAYLSLGDQRYPDIGHEALTP